MLIYAVLNLCRVEIQPNSSDLQNLYWKLTDMDPVWPQEPSSQRSLLLDWERFLLHTCDTVKTQNVFTNLFIEKDFNLTLCLWMSLREMRWSCTTSATSWVQFGSMGIDQPWKTQPQPLCLQDLPGNQVNCRALFEDAVFNTHSKVFCDCGYFFCVLYLFKNVLLVSSW